MWSRDCRLMLTGSSSCMQSCAFMCDCLGLLELWCILLDLLVFPLWCVLLLLAPLNYLFELLLRESWCVIPSKLDKSNPRWEIYIAPHLKSLLIITASFVEWIYVNCITFHHPFAVLFLVESCFLLLRDCFALFLLFLVALLINSSAWWVVNSSSPLIKLVVQELFTN